MNLRMLNLLLICLLLSGAAIRQASGRPGAPAAPAAEDIYTEDFTSYGNKDSTDNIEWEATQGRLRLSREDDNEQSSGDITVDAAGNTYAVWLDSRNGTMDIYAQKLDANGNRLWPSDVQVNTDAGRLKHEQPSVGLAPDGTAFVVWGSEGDGESYGDNVYMQKLSTNGVKLWSSDLRINQDLNTAIAYRTKHVLVDASGNAIVAWSTPSINKVQKFDGSGNRLWPTDVSMMYWSSADIDGQGNIYVTWHEFRSGNNDIYAQSISPAGILRWSNAVRVNSDTGLNNQENPNIAVDSSGNAWIVWEDRNENYQKYAQLLESTGGKLWQVDRPIPGEGWGGWPRMVSDKATGRMLRVWRESGSIVAQLFGPSGDAIWPTTIQITPSSVEGGYISSADLSLNSNGVATILLAKDPGFVGMTNNLGGDLLAQQVDLSGVVRWPNAQRIHADLGRIRQGAATVAVDSGGNTVTAWYDGRHGSSIYVQKVDVSGTKLWSSDLYVAGGNGSVSAPGMAIDSNDNILITWSANNTIFVQKRDRNGNRVWQHDLQLATGSSPVIGTSGNNIVVTWFANSGLHAQKLNANGTKLWVSAMQVNANPTATYRSHLDLAADLAGNIFVSWAERPTGTYDSIVYIQKLDGSGTRLWPTDLKVSAFAAEDQWNPALAVDHNNNAIVVWDEYRNTDYDLYAQKISPGGNRVWASDSLVNGIRDSSPGSPDIAMDANGNALIVWADQRTPSLKIPAVPMVILGGGMLIQQDIYAQKLNSSGTRLWASDVRVNTDVGAPTLAGPYPAVDLDSGGNAIVAWNDYIHGNSDIFLQKLNQAGSRAWLGDIQVVAPDMFAVPAGTARSRTIDTLAENIATAHLTAEAQTNGGGVQFFLSNTGGASWIPAQPGVTTVFTTAGSDLRWRADLTADLVRFQSPTIGNVRIAYSTRQVNTDAYEIDNTCAQAMPITVNGAAQTHTFHQQADADWIRFPVVADTTYIIHTPTFQQRSNPYIEVFETCAGPPVASSSPVLGAEPVPWRTTADGTLFVKLTNDPVTIFGEQTDYTVTVRRLIAPVALIVGGRDNGSTLQANIDYTTDLAYRTLLQSTVPKANIRYYSPSTNRDVDGNGLHDDITGVGTAATVQDAIETWARSRGVGVDVPFFIYLADHGYYDQFLVAGTASRITAAELDLWLSNLEATTGANQITIILEACRSGSFIDVTAAGLDSISRPNRVVIASAASYQNAYPAADGTRFSNTLWTALGQNQDVYTAFTTARQSLLTTGLEQSPWLDDNNTRGFDVQDGKLARLRGLAQSLGDSAPIITSASIDASGVIQVQVEDDFGVERVWVEIYRPDFVEPPPTSGTTPPPLNIPTIMLSHTNGNTYVGTYS